jgi:uncharacterized NAD-dependent epimerase/dehydratase family protein
MVILAEGRFHHHTSKTANGVIRFVPDEVVAVIDSTQAGKTTQDVIGAGGDIPVVAALVDALAFSPNTLLIGIAPPGGRLPEHFVSVIRQAIIAGLDVVSGLHTFVGDDAELASLADQYGVAIEDYRQPPKDLHIAEMRWRDRKAKVVLGVGIDANIGKMSTAIALWKDFQALGHRADFVATGQTGIAIAGWGVSVDALPSDFVSGAIEDLIDKSTEEHDIIFLEGQGSLMHQGYSSVATGILHGAIPDAMILSLEANRTANDFGMPYPEIAQVIRLHENMVSIYRESKVVGVSLVTFGLEDAAARTAIADTEKVTGLPTADPLRFGTEPLRRALEEYFGL